MAITKTNFINFTRCPRYASLAEIKKDRLDADVSYKDYKIEEIEENLEEIVGSMYELNEESGEETDLVDKVNRQLEAMMDYYKLVETEAGRISEKTFGGKSTYALKTKEQECFDFSMNGIKYMCYVDIYNENQDGINIIEVKSTTSKKYMELVGGHKNCEKFSIWERINNINYLKGELPGYDIEAEMPIKKYTDHYEKFFDRYRLGQYIYDLAIQRYFIEHEYQSTHTEDRLKNFHYYLAVLNADYIFDGTYVDGKPVYNPDADGNELITFFDMTKVTEDYQKFVDADREKLERYLNNLDAAPCPLGDYCGYKKQSGCKFFSPICGKMIPPKNSSLSYIHNGFGFVNDDGERIKGLELINEGYINLMDIPESWIKKKSHQLQRDCYEFNHVYIDKEKIRDGIKQIKYPIYHLDFETMPCPVPRFKGEWPYIQSPFEFSLHIEREPGVCDKDKDNIVFLAKTHQDEREEMIKLMLKYMNPNEGTLFAQNVAFEKGRIKELARMFPEYHDDLMKLYDRGFDLLWIVNTNSKMYMDLGYDEERAKTFNFYDKRLSGSFSIKKTLPVFSDLRYDNLVVKNGTEAIVEYANYEKMSKEEYALKYQALITYCKQDTWAMVEILNALRKLVK
jgi:hypothetical protein